MPSCKDGDTVRRTVAPGTFVLQLRRESWSRASRGVDICPFLSKLDLMLALCGYGRCPVHSPHPPPRSGRRPLRVGDPEC